MAALVIDPVMVSTSGDMLAGPNVLDEFRYVIAIALFFGWLLLT